MKYSVCLEIRNESPCIGWAVISQHPAIGYDVAVRGIAGLKTLDTDGIDSALAKLPRRRLPIPENPQTASLLSAYDLFHDLGILPPRPAITDLNSEPYKTFRKYLITLAHEHDGYRLRRDALDRPLHPWELFLAILHIFHRKGHPFFAENLPKSYDEVTQEFLRILETAGCRTLGEAMFLAPYPARDEIKALSLSTFVPRSLTVRETDAIWRRQEEFGSPCCNRRTYGKLMSALGGRLRPDAPEADEPPEQLIPLIPPIGIKKLYRENKTMTRLNSEAYSKMTQAVALLSRIFFLLGRPAQIYLRSYTTLIRGNGANKIQGAKERQKNLSELNELVKSKNKHIYASLNSAAKLKLALHEEQKGVCPYSLQKISKKRLLSNASYANVDHILPLSRSADDSYENKVLVIIENNNEKGSRTPIEYIGGDEKRWSKYEKWVCRNIADPIKRDNLLCVNIRANDHENRNVAENIARWIAECDAEIEVIVEPSLGEKDRGFLSMIRLIEKKPKPDNAAFAEELKKIVPNLARPEEPLSTLPPANPNETPLWKTLAQGTTGTAHGEKIAKLITWTNGA